jgi:outer membrane protein TolC
MLSGMDTAWHKLRSMHTSVESYREAAKYNEHLLDAALTRLEAGKIDSRKVLEIEADLLDARNSVAESLVRDEIARLELEVLEGVLLQERNLEVTQSQLEAVTRKFTNTTVGDDEYRRTLMEVRALYQGVGRPVSDDDKITNDLLRRKMHQEMRQLDMHDERLDKN